MCSTQLQLDVPMYMLRVALTTGVQTDDTILGSAYDLAERNASYGIKPHNSGELDSTFFRPKLAVMGVVMALVPLRYLMSTMRKRIPRQPCAHRGPDGRQPESLKAPKKAPTFATSPPSRARALQSLCFLPA
ncbi:hypothetical protein BKA70DRAFT_1397945 [Coprinopsis sp. MPI-PUGE-AT-0042]|nr:hypothetical protein BKA70DRAFT_1397945 [Coprinopsis sp. MPI-PUGE-AT-0042]